MMMDDEMDSTMDEGDGADEVAAPAVGMDARKIRETLDQVLALVSELQAALPDAEDSGEEQADTIDEATAEAPTDDSNDGDPKEGAGSEDKAMRKASAIAMIKKQLG